jgi:hypothetical protein
MNVLLLVTPTLTLCSVVQQHECCCLLLSRAQVEFTHSSQGILRPWLCMCMPRHAACAPGMRSLSASPGYHCVCNGLDSCHRYIVTHPQRLAFDIVSASAPRPLAHAATFSRSSPWACGCGRQGTGCDWRVTRRFARLWQTRGWSSTPWAATPSPSRDALPRPAVSYTCTRLTSLPPDLLRHTFRADEPTALLDQPSLCDAQASSHPATSRRLMNCGGRWDHDRRCLRARTAKEHCI